MITESRLTVMVSRSSPERIEAHTAQASNPISRPANGRTGQNPWAVNISATVKVGTATRATKMRAVLGVSERCAASSSTRSAPSLPSRDSGIGRVGGRSARAFIVKVLLSKQEAFVAALAERFLKT
jgi:hypothetical protein